MSNAGAFAVGVVAALIARTLAPPLGRRLRPVARGAIKQGIILSEGAQARAAGLREDLEDLVAEAREELRTDTGAGSSQEHPGSTSGTPVAG